MIYNKINRMNNLNYKILIEIFLIILNVSKIDILYYNK